MAVIVSKYVLTPFTHCPYTGGYSSELTRGFIVPPVNTGLPVITGALDAGSVLTTTNGTWTSTETLTYSYQWKRGSTNITGATLKTYVVSADDVSFTITVTVTARDIVNNSASATAVPVGPVGGLFVKNLPIISGTVTVGSTLTTTNGVWVGTPTPTFTYQWNRNGVPIVGETANTYLLVLADSGASITVTVTGTNTSGSIAATSPQKGPVASAIANTVAPVISGGVVVGLTLSTTNGTWTGSPAPSFAYQWKRDGVNISGATGSTYILVLADVGTMITCSVTGSNSVNSITVPASNSIGPIVATITLTLSPATIPANATIGTTIGAFAVAGGTGTYTYTLTSSPSGQFVVSGSNLNVATALVAGSYPISVSAAGGIPTPVTNSFMITVTTVAPVNTVLPVISGVPQVGITLSTSNGTWTFSPASYAYQWKRNGVDIGSATTNTYLLVSADNGATITVVVTATNAGGSGNATSLGVGPVTVAAPPVNITLPVVSGAARVGQVLTTSNGAWTNSPSSYSYQWKRSFSPIDLVGLIDWWDASVPSSFTLAGTTVNGWQSQAPGGRNLVTCCGRVQSYSATGFNISYPGVTFPGGSNFLETATAFPMGTGNTLTLWCVCTLGTGGSRIMSYCAPGTNDYNSIGSWLLYSASPYTTVSFQRNGAIVTASNLAPSPTGHRIIVTIDATGLITLYVNGTVAATATMSGNWITNGAVDLARQASHDDSFWYGTIANAGVAASYNDATTVGLLDVYLRDKSGLAPVTQFLARTTGLDAAHINAYTALINGLVTDGIWDKLDVLYIFATNSSTNALQNLKSNNYNATNNGTTFAADRGFTGVDGSSTIWINSNFNPAAVAGKYKQNDCHIAAWANTNSYIPTSGNGIMMGQIVGGGGQNYTALIPRDATNTTFFSVCSNNAPTQTTNLNGAGHYIVNRSSSAGHTTYKNGVSFYTATIGSNPPMNQVMGVLALMDQSTGPHQGYGGQCSAISMGGSFTATEAANFTNRLNTYMLAVGVTPIDPAATFLARTTGLDATHITAYTNLINGLWNDGVWDKLDALYIFATNSSANALLNLVSTSYNATAVGSPTFTADRGFTGTENSTTTYLNSNFNPTTALSPKFTQNSAHASYWIPANMAGTSKSPIGVTFSNNASISLNPRYSADDKLYCQITCGNVYFAGGVTNINTSGHYIGNRPDSTNLQVYKNGGSFATNVSSPSAVPPNYPVIINGQHIDGTPYGSLIQLASASIGAGLTAANAVSMYSRLADYLVAVGAYTPATLFLSRTSGLDATHQTAYTNLINGLVTDGIWNKLDVLHIYATQDATTALLNLKSGKYNATLGGAPTFTADRGFTGVDASTSVFINSNYNSLSSGGNYSQNSSHMSMWVLNDFAGNNPSIGNYSGSNSNYVYAKFTDNTSYFRMNVVAAAGQNAANADARGHYIGNRSGATAVQGYKNGAIIYSSAAQTSIAQHNLNIYAIGGNNNGTAAGVGQQQAMLSIGGSLDATETANFYTRLRTYMTAVGVP